MEIIYTQAINENQDEIVQAVYDQLETMIQEKTPQVKHPTNKDDYEVFEIEVHTAGGVYLITFGTLNNDLWAVEYEKV